MEVLLQDGQGEVEVARRGDLDRARVAVDHRDATPVSSTRAASSVAPAPPAWRAVEHLAPESLRCLDGAQRARAGVSRSTRPESSTTLTVSVTGRTGHHRRAAARDPRDDRLEQRGRAPARAPRRAPARRRRRRRGPQAGGHRRAALGAPGDDVDPHGADRPRPTPSATTARAWSAAGRGDDHDVPHSSTASTRSRACLNSGWPCSGTKRLGDSRPRVAHRCPAATRMTASAQEARTSSRMASALSSLVFSASASSETRI